MGKGVGRARGWRMEGEGMEGYLPLQEHDCIQGEVYGWTYFYKILVAYICIGYLFQDVGEGSKCASWSWEVGRGDPLTTTSLCLSDQDYCAPSLQSSSKLCTNRPKVCGKNPCSPCTR